MATENRPGEVKEPSAAKMRFETDWHSGVLDFERVNDLLTNLDDVVVRIGQRDNSAIEPYIALLDALFLNLNPIIYSKVVTARLDAKIIEIRKEITAWINLPDMNMKKYAFQTGIAAKLRDLHKELLMYRQYIGMGVRVHQTYSTAERTEKALIPETARPARQQL